MGKQAQRTDFQIKEFELIISQKGYSVIWQKAIKCPCIPEERTAQPDFNCALCHGKGWYWFDDMEIKAIMTSFTEQLKYNQTGEIPEGTVSVTTLSQNKLGPWDRLTNLHSRVRHSSVLTKGDHGGKDLLRYQPTEIIHCRSIEKEFREGIDFTFDPNSFEINWLPNGLEPPTGTRYSIGYEMPPRWVIIDVFPIRDTYAKSKRAGITFVELPLRATARLEHQVFGIIDP